MTEFPPAEFLKRDTPPHTATLVLMIGIGAMAINMFLPSLPSMSAYFDVDYAVMQLSVALFLAVNGVLQVVVGPLSDRFGRRPVLLVGLAVFIGATIGCLLAPTAAIFLVFRMMQAAVVAPMVLGRAVVRDIHSQDRAASVLGYVTMWMAIVPMVTPAIGGMLDEVFGWKASFVVMLMSGIGCFVLGWADLGETNRHKSTNFGEQFREYPSLIRSPRFWGYSAAAALASGGFFAYLGGAPFVGSTIFHLSPGILGVMFATPAIGYIGGNWATSRFSARIGINRMIVYGSLIAAIGLTISLVLFLAGLANAYLFFGLMTLMGVGNGAVMPNATVGLMSVRPHLAGTASGLGGALMIGGGAGLSALAGSLLGPETGATPLLALMTIVLWGCYLSIMLVIWRERRLGLA